MPVNLVPCLKAFDPEFNDGVYPKYLQEGAGYKSNPVYSGIELAQAWCPKQISLRDVLKKGERAMFIEALQKTAPELADALLNVKKQFDFIYAILDCFNRKNESNQQITLENELDYILKNHPLDGIKITSLCTACRMTIIELLRECVEEIIQERKAVQKPLKRCDLKEDEYACPRL